MSCGARRPRGGAIPSRSRASRRSPCPGLRVAARPGLGGDAAGRALERRSAGGFERRQGGAQRRRRRDRRAHHRSAAGFERAARPRAGPASRRKIPVRLVAARRRGRRAARRRLRAPDGRAGATEGRPTRRDHDRRPRDRSGGHARGDRQASPGGFARLRALRARSRARRREGARSLATKSCCRRRWSRSAPRRRDLIC